MSKFLDDRYMVKHGFEPETLLSDSLDAGMRLKQLADRPMHGALRPDAAQQNCSQLAWQFMKPPISPKRQPCNTAADLQRAPREMDCAQLAWSFMQPRSERPPARENRGAPAPFVAPDRSQLSCSEMAWYAPAHGLRSLKLAAHEPSPVLFYPPPRMRYPASHTTLPFICSTHAGRS